MKKSYLIELSEGLAGKNTFKHMKRVDYKSFFFSGGEPFIRFDDKSVIENKEPIEVWIFSRVNNGNDLLKLISCKDALDIMVINSKFMTNKMINFNLVVPYVPGARQDRVSPSSGESLTARVYANLINNMKFDKVLTVDNHSDVATALIHNSTNLSYVNYVEYAMMHMYNELQVEPGSLNIVCPDAGAGKKIMPLMKQINDHEDADDYYDLIMCDKKRDMRTGELSGFTVYADDLKGQNLLIPDDICDGGATFIGLAEELKKKNAGDLYLYVTHGIFSKGLKELAKHFKHIYTTNSIKQEFHWEQVEREPTELVTIIDIFE